MTQASTIPRTTLITGASSGLGAEMARQLAALGHPLALGARRTERLEELRTEIQAARPGHPVHLRALDVNDHDQVFQVVRAFRDDFAAEGLTLDRVVVNAGIGKGAPLGTGRFDANRETAMTNFVGALAQVEAAMEVFRAQGSGHLVIVSGVSAVRGMPKSMTTYAASKAAVAHLAEGLRAELLRQPDQDHGALPRLHRLGDERHRPRHDPPPLMVSTERGVRSMVAAIEAERATAHVPGLPWEVLARVIRHAPMPLFRRLV